MLKVITEGPYGTKFSEDMSHGTVVVESDAQPRRGSNNAIDELQSTAARNLAIGHAAQRGMADPRLNGMTVPTYPVNQKGIPLDQVRDDKGQQLPPVHPEMKVWRFRAEIQVTRKLV